MGKRLKITGHQFLSRVADDTTKRGVNLEPTSIRMAERQADRGIQHGGTEAFLAAMKGFLGELLILENTQQRGASFFRFVQQAPNLCFRTFTDAARAQRSNAERHVVGQASQQIYFAFIKSV